MTCHNSMKADEYAHRQGEMDGLDAEVDRVAWIVAKEMPEFMWQYHDSKSEEICVAEAKRRVMQEIKERNEP